VTKDVTATPNQPPCSSKQRTFDEGRFAGWHSENAIASLDAACVDHASDSDASTCRLENIGDAKAEWFVDHRTQWRLEPI